jgi:CTP synthase
MNEELKSKIGLFCNVLPSAVFEEKDVDFSIYEVPLVLARQGLDELIVNHLGIKTRPAQLGPWKEMIDSIRKPARNVEVALVGKYIELQDAYKSILESLAHGGIANRAKVVIRRIRAEDLEEKDAQRLLAGVHGILVPGGFGMRGIEGKVKAVKYARENMIPFFGICLGMQCAVIEVARDLCGLARANSTEFDEKTPAPVICLMDAQRKVTRKGGTMRLGAYPCKLSAGSKAREAYGTAVVQERHRHRYEFNKDYRKGFEKRGVVFSGLSPDGKLAEIIELRGHPWFVAVQFHPEFKSKPVAAHPLFRSFIAAALEKSGQVTLAAAGGTVRRTALKGE